MLANSGKFIMDDYTKSMLRSVTTQSGAYSEVFVRGGDLPPAIGRLFPDPFSLLSASSRADDFEAVRAYTNQGISTADAIESVLRDRRSQ
jgi:conjugal transfer ATP-binding protein TraC